MCNFVKCDLCESQYESIMDIKYNQGDGCSATLYFDESDKTLKIQGHYGSCLIDMEIWAFVDEAFNNIKLKPNYNICDKCIQKLIDAKSIIKIHDCIL